LLGGIKEEPVRQAAIGVVTLARRYADKLHLTPPPTLPLGDEFHIHLLTLSGVRTLRANARSIRTRQSYYRPVFEGMRSAIMFFLSTPAGRAWAQPQRK
jgi:hypothetical protein